MTAQKFVWYDLGSKADHEAVGLTQMKLDFNVNRQPVYVHYAEQSDLDGDIRKGFVVQYLDNFLPVGVNDANPFIQRGNAVYTDENDHLWLGLS